MMYDSDMEAEEALDKATKELTDENN